MATDRTLWRYLAAREGAAKMPRYYFHIEHGQMTVLDHAGADLVSFDAAVKEAVRRGQEIVTRSEPHVIIVADDNLQTVYELISEGSKDEVLTFLPG